jgi:hypothetical protein
MSEPKEIGKEQRTAPTAPTNPAVCEAYADDLTNESIEINTGPIGLRSGDFARFIRRSDVGEIIRARRNRCGSGRWSRVIELSAMLNMASVSSANGRYLTQLGDYDGAQPNFGRARALYQQLSSFPDFDLLSNMGVSRGDLHEWSTSMEIASIVPETSAHFRNITLNPYQTFTPSQSLSSLVDSEFSRVSRDSNVPSGRLSKIQGGFWLAKANYYLRLARTFRVRNRALAQEAAEHARDILLEVLRRQNNIPEIALSAMLSLGWAYTTLANLAEENQRGEGRNDALRAVAIYRIILYGNNALTSESQELQSAASEIAPLIVRNQARVTNISSNLTTLRAGRSLRIDPPDACAQVATNELEINLRLADALSLARRYEDSLSEYQQIIRLESSLPRPDDYPLRRNLFFGRARVGLTNALTAQANDVYSQTGNRQEAERILAEALTTSEQAFGQLRQGMEEETSRYGRNGRSATILPLVLDQYRQEVLKLGDSTAWAYASRGRILRQEDGNGTEDLQRARRIYLSMHFTSSDPRLRGGSDIAAFINQFTSQLAVNDRRLMRMQTETYITTDGLHHRRGDIQRDLQEYGAAVREYGEVNQHAGMYLRARLARIGANIDQARFLYTQRHDIDGAREGLERLRVQVDAIRNNSDYPASIRFNASLAAQRVRSTLAWLEIQAMNRAEANRHLDEAIGILRNISENPDQYNNDSWLEANETPAHLTYMLAELQRMRGERDQSVLLQADASYERAIQLYGSQGDNRRNQLGIREARLARIEGGIARARLLTDAGEINAAAGLLNNATINNVAVLIRELFERGHTRLGYRAINTLTWILGRRGGLEERVRGEGAGRRHFQQAIQVLNSLLANEFTSSDQTLQAIRQRRETLMDENFLSLAETTRGNLLLTQAELMKAAGVRNPRGLEAAARIYQQAIEAIPDDANHRLAYLNQIARENARVGIVETSIARGQLQEELGRYEQATSLYESALSQIAEVIPNLQMVHELESARINLRTFNALNWGVSSLGRLREEIADESGEDVEIRPRDEHLISLMLNRAIFRGENAEAVRARLARVPWAADDPEAFERLWQEVGARGDELLGENVLTEAVRIFGENRADIMNGETLFASDTNLWALRFGFVGSHISARLYEDAINEYELAVEDASRVENIGIRELEFLSGIHSAIGDVYCYRLRRFRSAQEIYERALQSIYSYLRTLHRSAPSEEPSNTEEYLNAINQLLENDGIPVSVRNILHQVRFGLAKVYVGRMGRRGGATALRILNAVLQSHEYQELAEAAQRRDRGQMGNLREGLTRRQLRILARAFLGIGDVYSYHLRNAQEGHRAYESARVLLEEVEGTVFRRIVAQSYMGSGDVARLRQRDFREAISEYGQGIGEINGLRDRESRKLRAQLLAAQAAAYAGLGQTGRAREVMQQALEIIEGLQRDPYDLDRDDIEQRIADGRSALWDDRARGRNHAELHYNIAYISSTWRGIPTDEDMEHNVGGCYNATRGMSLCVDYTNGIPLGLPPFTNSSSGDLLERLQAERSHGFRVAFDVNREGNRFNYRVRPFLSGNVRDYTIWEHSFSSDYSSVDQLPGYPREQVRRLFNLTPGIEAGFDYRADLTPNLLMLLGIDAGLSVIVPLDPNPIAEATRVSAAEEEAATGRNMESRRQEADQLENGTLVSWSIRPNARLILPSWHASSSFVMHHPTFSIGGNFGQDPISTTAQGFWPLQRVEVDEETGERNIEESSTTRAAFTFGFQTRFNIGRESRFRIPLSFYGEVGTHTYLQGSLGFEYNFNPLGIEFNFTGSWFNDEANESSTTSFGGMFRLRF